MKILGNVLTLLLALLLVGVAGYVLFIQAAPLLEKPCEKPLTYTVATPDPRFGISKEGFIAALKDAETVWEETAGRDLFEYSREGEIAVSLVYGDEQKTAELGEVISDEQKDYDAKKAELETLKTIFEAAKTLYEKAAEQYDEQSAKYHEQVTYWNNRGGAPPEEYEKINEMREELEEKQKALKELAEKANAASLSINESVDELNALARKLNAKVDVFNENAGDEFDQGDYQEDKDGKRIHVYKFESGTDLRRVLVHEFGHALSIGHVENPASVMYSYNAGSGIELSEEDKAALVAACELDK